MTTKTGAKSEMMNKKWTIVLAASLALNCFLLGVIAVHAVRRPQRVFGPALDERGAPPMLLGELVRGLGGPHDPRVEELWRSRRGELHEVRREIAQARREVKTALATEPFNREALQAALDKLNQTLSHAQQRSSDAVITLAEQLRPEERARIGSLEVADPPDFPMEPPQHRRAGQH